MEIQRPTEKLAEGYQFTVDGILHFFWEAWDNANKRFEVSPQPVPATNSGDLRFAKKWLIKTKTGTLKLSQAQIADCLEKCLQKTGTANLIGKSFRVKTNGKTGMEIRYWFNPMREPEAPVAEVQTSQELQGLDEVPF